jgi:8-oxo-dGTP pyrophosphatase MutT (NUDIX family)
MFTLRSFSEGGPLLKITESAGGVVLNSKGEVLVVNQHGNSWSLPKGHLDKGEDALTAARREIREESGVDDLELLDKLGTYERFRIGLDKPEDRSSKKRITLFLFRTPQMKLNPADPENPQALWVPREKVAELLTHEKDKQFFLTILKCLPKK